MSDVTFNLSPTVEVLQWLAQGSLRQNFLVSVRLWVWLRFLYDEEGRSPPDPFTYAQCRDLLFTDRHPRDDTIPPLHDPRCRCAQTTSQLLFGDVASDLATWRKATQPYFAPAKLDALLKRRPFAITRRSLAKDLKLLVQLGWLEPVGQSYRRVKAEPELPIASSEQFYNSVPQTTAIDLLHPDLATIVHNLSLRTKDGLRFFLQLDYVVPEVATDDVDRWQEILREVWKIEPVPPVQLTYRSARERHIITSVVYPVCAYYVRRGVYLCGFNPELKHGWYNYRLDKIQALIQLDWSDPRVPDSLKECARKGQLPTPGYVEEQMSRAWGFDFYLPSQLLLLRFERQFHQDYVADTVRHETFIPIDYERAIAIVRREATPKDAEALLANLATRSPTDAYYRANYRVHDTNVIQRLRAWRPHMEVLLPASLRQLMAEEVATEFGFYHS